MDEEQHVVGHQPAQRQHFSGEEVGPRQQRHVGPNEGRPRGRALALRLRLRLRRRRQTVAPQNITDRLIGNLVSVPVLAGHANDQSAPPVAAQNSEMLRKHSDYSATAIPSSA
jgi:hypothetical protein